MVNNLEIIAEELLNFTTEDDFYFLQIIKRKKEHPELGSNSYVVKTYYIKSIEDLNKCMGEIICLCDYHNARAYIDLNKRSFKKIAFHTLKKITDQLLQEDYKSVKNAYNSSCGMYANDPAKKWIIDLDDDAANINMINKIVNIINDIEPVGTKLKAILPTRNGMHLIVSPFNKEKFKREFPAIDIHTNNPTILYIP